MNPTLTEPINISPVLAELLFIEFKWSVFRQGITEYFLNMSNHAKHVYILLKEKADQLENIKFKTWRKIH